jgi:hypothetical protein
MFLGLAVLERRWVRKKTAAVIAKLVVGMLPYDRIGMNYDDDEASDSDDGQESFALK